MLLKTYSGCIEYLYGGKAGCFEGEISMALSGLCGKVVNTKLTYYNKSTLYITSYLQIDCLFCQENSSKNSSKYSSNKKRQGTSRNLHF